MPEEIYAELHTRSAFSFLRGASNPEHLIEQAARLGLKSVALCDRDGVYGAPRFYAKACELGIKAIVGAELTMEDGSILPVLVRERKGYQNLCRLITRAKLRAAKNQSRIGWTELAEFRDGLVALTGDREGPLFPNLLRQDRNEAKIVLKRLQAIFTPGNLYIEIQRHRSRKDDGVVKGLIEIAHSNHVPVLATNGVLYAEAWGREVLDVFTSALHHTHLDAAGFLLEPNDERRLKSGMEMADLFADIPEAIAQTQRLAGELSFSLENLGYEFPVYSPGTGETAEAALRRLALEGARQRYGKLTAKIKHQLEHELELIIKLGFAGYFLIVHEIVNFARKENILVQGRGSAANSAVCYTLGITAVDPIGCELLFERFLSEGRKSWPDIDLDFPSGDRREQVIQEVFRRYGRHGAAMTANVITYRGRSIMRELGKALNFSEDVLKRFSDLYASGDFEHTLELERQVEQAGVPRSHPRFETFIRLFYRMYGLPRHLGQHSGGMIICQGQLDQIVPLENASMPGRVVAQWDKDDCEDLGIIKVDLLGLGMMAVLQDAVELTKQRGRSVTLETIPKDDPATFELMQRADTVGVFQIESRAQMATLPRMKPKTFYDVAIEVAIIRPGPIVGKLAHPYLNRRAGKETVSYPHPDLKPVLERTLGIPLFQEQMLKMAMIMADFSGSEAEELRRAISFHRSTEKMDKVVLKLRANMSRRNVAPETQEQIIASIRSFALYGFPESHAISFALLAYASCYLKVHRAPEFYCALLNNQPMGFYSPATLIKDGQRRGVRFRPICVMESLEECFIQKDDSIRLGLNYVQGLCNEMAARIVRERKSSLFDSLEDFLDRVPLDKSERRTLGQIGALNALVPHRRAALWGVEVEQESLDLFRYCQKGPSPLAMMNPMERIHADFNGTRLTIGKHPMAYLRDRLSHVISAAHLHRRENGETVCIAGAVICRQRPGTAKGHVFISLEDETGISNAIVHCELFEKLRLRITHEGFLEIEGKLQKQEGVVTVLAKDVRPLHYPASISTPSYDFH